jgi:hypothetical protein
MASLKARPRAALSLLTALLLALAAFWTSRTMADIQPGTGDQAFPDDLKTWDWSNRFGKPFGPGNFGNLTGATSSTFSEVRHISAVRVTTGSGLDILTFDFARTSYENGDIEWLETEHAQNMIYKYSQDDQEYVRSGEPQPGRFIRENTNKHQLTVVKLRPEDRLEQITVYSPAGKAFSLSGVTLHILTKTGYKRDVDVMGTKGYKQNPLTLGKAGCEIVQIKVYHNHQPEAVGVRYRAIEKGK